jgi:phage gp29-like protein
MPTDIAQKPKKSRKSSAAAIAQWQPSIPITWSFGQIKSALRSLTQGDFSRSSQLFRSMQEDDEIPESLEKLVDSVLRAPFTVECEDEKILELTKELACKIMPDGELTSSLESKVIQGFAIGVIDWIKNESVWFPVLRFLDSEFASYDAQRHIWRYNTTNGPVDVTPGDGLWVLWCDGEYGYLRAKIRQLGMLWYFKNDTYRSWNRYNERHGLPIVKAFIPLAGEATEKEDFVDDIHEMGSEGVVPLVVDQDEWNSYDLELLEAKDQSWETFQALIDRIDRKIQKLFNGGNLQSEVASTGSNRAAAETHQSERDAIKAKSLSQKMSEWIREQILRPFVLMNFGETAEIPTVCWETEPAEDKVARATGISTLATGLKTLGEAGYTVDNIQDVVEEYGLELTYEKPETLKPQPKPVMGKPAPGRKLALASGDDSDGALEGVLFADQLAEEVGLETARLIKPSVKTLMSMVRSADSYPDLENRIKVAFAHSDPSELADLLEQAMMLAQLDGRHSVIKDAATEENR